MSEKKWYILRTNPKAEKKVALRLTTLGIENYLPLRKQIKSWSDRKKLVSEVLFKSFVFVYLTEKERQNVFEVPGIVRYLYFAGKIATLSEKEIEHIKYFCSLDDIKIDENYEKGDQVEVINGQLIGLKGELICSTSGNRLKIYIPVLDCFANITISKTEVRKIQVAV
ncbi:UpxY family transcription antiterminator [Paenimyroides aestuarii]|uniref:UpxY family transcription antiterminator n=1 Tax=Paenimyroides aestuarii TaxID=2968490 RepID=A0ABY5NQD2_9FLAO|nr:UpxY family transcription antiterminator [Paenimyroides aestuarii]UUV20776.1 UpxY family transcription antiterminator [Paenimyroides aestuarii]